jgi:hypothetical protein
MKEKKPDIRKSQRYFYVTPLRYKGAGDYENLDALSINISEEGIYFQSNHDLPEGHKFILQFKIPGNTEILEAKCRVIHRSEAADGSGFAIGCQIEEIKGIEKSNLRNKLIEAFGDDPDRIY